MDPSALAGPAGRTSVFRNESGLPETIAVDRSAATRGESLFADVPQPTGMRPDGPIMPCQEPDVAAASVAVEHETTRRWPVVASPKGTSCFSRALCEGPVPSRELPAAQWTV